MMRKLHSYESEDLIVDYDVKRCIHAEECVHGLPEVFDTGRRPWIDPKRAATADLIRVIERCPTGALHYRRRQGGEDERAQATNTIRISADGPLYLKGHLRITLPGGGGETLNETRVALCRCGQSKDKPFCDNSHRETGFSDAGAIAENRLKPWDGSEAAALEISLATNGPILFRGPVEIQTPEGETVDGARGALCRCGQSATKPFCDGSHKTIGFEAD